MFSRLSVLAFFILTLVLVASSFTTPLNAQDDSLQIVIDGQINDWQAAPPGIDDPQGDSQSDLDLKSARAFTQGDSFYLMIAFHTPPSDEAAIEVLVDVNGDQTPDYRLDLNDAIGQMDVIDLARPDATPVVPLRAQIAQDDALEFKTPLTALNNATNFSLTSIATADQADVMGPLGVPVVDETQPVTRIVIDGEPGDWEDYPTWAHDLQHDSHGALDLKTVKTFTNDRYWYVMIEAYDITGPYEILNIPIDMERGGDPEYWLGFNPRLGFIGIADQTDPGAHRAVEGAQVAEGSVIELKIPLSAVEYDTTFYIGAVQV
ncbi:MAG: hypothetical protein GYB66_00455, partial [Chloroflexi bacterium]|nr:hypothetical protein [Chloroflexota bacterium]